MVWLLRSFRRIDDMVPVIREHPGAPSAPPRRVGGTRRRRRPAPGSTGWPPPIAGIAQSVADLARDVRFHFVDEPLLAAAVAEEYARAERELRALRADPDRPDRATRIDRLVACPQPLRDTLLSAWRGSTGPGSRRGVLEVYTRRYYRSAGSAGLRFAEHGGQPLCAADYAAEGERVHLVAAYVPLSDLPGWPRDRRAPGHGGARRPRWWWTWPPGATVGAGEDAGRRRGGKAPAECGFGRPLQRT